MQQIRKSLTSRLCMWPWEIRIDNRLLIYEVSVQPANIHDTPGFFLSVFFKPLQICFNRSRGGRLNSLGMWNSCMVKKTSALIYLWLVLCKTWSSQKSTYRFFERQRNDLKYIMINNLRFTEAISSVWLPMLYASLFTRHRAVNTISCDTFG